MTDWPLAFGVTPTTWDGKVIGIKPHDEVCRELAVMRDAGLQWVHLAGYHFEEPCDFDLDDAVITLKKQLDDHGIKVASYHCYAPTYTTPGQDQQQVRQRLLDTVAMLAPLESVALVLHPGRPWGHQHTMMGFCNTYLDIVEQTSHQAVMETAAENLRMMSKAAAENGSTLALENVGRWEPLADVETLPQLITMIDDPNAGYCLDTGHAHAFGQCNKQWLQTIGKQLFATHFNDNHARGVACYPKTGFVELTAEIDEHLPVGFGTIPWLEVITQLLENDYQGIVSFETKGWPDTDPVQSLTQAVAWWRACTRLAISKLKPVASL